MSLRKRLGLLAATTLAVGGLGAVAAPSAQAGGPGTTYIYGSTKAKCATNLKNSVEAQRVFGHTVTNIHGCRPTGDGTRWFGDYVVR